jgi:hypothetical protein
MGNSLTAMINRVEGGGSSSHYDHHGGSGNGFSY